MTITYAEELMSTLISLREKAEIEGSKENLDKYKKHQRKCIEGFKYIIKHRASRYKGYSNYEDLLQDGVEALLQAMKTYKPEKGIFFYWAHKYIDTRIARRASLHTAIRFPMAYTKKVQPYREARLPKIYEPSMDPEARLENKEVWKAINASYSKLPDNQRKVAEMFFGVEDGNPVSIWKICRKLKISQPDCEGILEQVVSSIKNEIKL